MLKMALLERVINKKCCSVDRGRGICPLVSSPTPGICHPSQKKCQCPGVSLKTKIKARIRARKRRRLRQFFAFPPFSRPASPMTIKRKESSSYG